MRRAALALLLCCAACGGTEVATPSTTPPVIGSAEVVWPTARTQLPPKSCTPDPATVQAMPVPLIPEVPREPLTPQGSAVGNEVAAKIRPELERVCASGDFSPAATQKALIGYDARVFRPDERVTAVAFVITLSSSCVLGEIRPTNVRISVVGTAKSARCE